jgi:hypothetical protein
MLFWVVLVQGRTQNLDIRPVSGLAGQEAGHECKTVGACMQQQQQQGYASSGSRATQKGWFPREVTSNQKVGFSWFICVSKAAAAAAAAAAAVAAAAAAAQRAVAQKGKLKACWCSKPAYFWFPKKTAVQDEQSPRPMMTN